MRKVKHVFIIAIAMVLALACTTTVFADTNTDGGNGGQAVNEFPERLLLWDLKDNSETITYDAAALSQDIKDEEKGYSWDADEKKLTINEYFSYGIYYAGDLHILINGSIWLVTQTGMNYGMISALKSLTIEKAPEAASASLRITTEFNGKNSTLQAGAPMSGSSETGNVYIGEDVNVDIISLWNSGSAEDRAAYAGHIFDPIEANGGDVIIKGNVSITVQSYLSASAIKANQVTVDGPAASLKADITVLENAAGNIACDKTALGVAGTLNVANGGSGSITVTNEYDEADFAHTAKAADGVNVSNDSSLTVNAAAYGENSASVADNVTGTVDATLIKLEAYLGPERILISPKKATDPTIRLTKFDLSSDIETDTYKWDAQNLTFTLKEGFDSGLYAEGDLDVLIDGNVTINLISTVNRGIIAVDGDLSIAPADKSATLTMNLNTTGVSTNVLRAGTEDAPANLYIRQGMTVNVNEVTSGASEQDPIASAKITAIPVGVPNGNIYVDDAKLNVSAEAYISATSINAANVEVKNGGALNINTLVKTNENKVANVDKSAIGVAGTVKVTDDSTVNINVRNEVNPVTTADSVVFTTLGAKSIIASDNAKVSVALAAAQGTMTGADEITKEDNAVVTVTKTDLTPDAEPEPVPGDGDDSSGEEPDGKVDPETDDDPLLDNEDSDKDVPPQTGVNNNIFHWIALLFISGGAVIVLTVYDRKRITAANK